MECSTTFTPTKPSITRFEPRWEKKYISPNIPTQIKLKWMSLLVWIKITIDQPLQRKISSYLKMINPSMSLLKVQMFLIINLVITATYCSFLLNSTSNEKCYIYFTVQSNNETYFQLMASVNTQLYALYDGIPI